LKFLLSTILFAVSIAGCAVPRAHQARPAETGPSSTPARPAVSVPEEMTLPKALELMTACNPGLSSAADRVRAAGGDITQAAAWPNPMIGVMVDGLSLHNAGNDQVTTKFQATQEFELGGKRSARTDAAAIMRDSVEAERHAILAAKRLDVTLAFNEALYVQESARIDKAILDATAELHKTAKDKLDSGKISRRESLRFDIALSDARLALENSSARIRPELATLAAAIGLPPSSSNVRKCVGELASVPAAGEAGAFLEKARERLTADNPELRLARTRVAVAEAALEHERAQRWPDLKAGLMYAHTEDDMDDEMVGALVEMRLPIWDARRGAIEAAEARIDAEKKALADAENGVWGAFERLQERLLTAQRSMAVYEKDILPKAQESLDISTAAFNAERLSYVETLDPLLSLLQAKRAHLGWLKELADAAARIEALTAQGAKVQEPGNK
jgi:cobalt-zinc-cadmium efflux system outer membrane protein